MLSAFLTNDLFLFLLVEQHMFFITACQPKFFVTLFTLILILYLRAYISNVQPVPSMT